MSTIPRYGLLPAAVLGFATLAQAQTATPPAVKPDPLDARASVPALVYESSFLRYRRIGDTAMIPWREANDTVNRIGGWRTYAREAQQADAPPAPPPTAAKPIPAPAGHSGHKSP